MSESVTEGSAGDTGEVASQDSGAGFQGHEEDQAAEEQLHKVMQEQDPEELRKQLDHWRTTAQRHEKTARNNSAAAKRLQEIEDANKSEIQKATERAEAAERERDAVNTQHNRMMAAAAEDLHPDLIDYLGDGTSKEITSRAEQLSGIIEAEVQKRLDNLSEDDISKLLDKLGRRANGTAGASRRRPVESLRAGAAPATTSLNTPDQMFRQLISGDQD